MLHRFRSRLFPVAAALPLWLAVGLWTAEATAASPTSITLSLAAASGNQKGQATGRLLDSGGAPILGAQVQLTVQPLDGPGVVAEYSASGTVPAGATTAIVGFRVNAECQCSGPSDFTLYKAQYGEGGEGTNRVPNGDFSHGLDSWGISGTGVTMLVPSDRGSGPSLLVSATAAQSVLANSSFFPVSAGAAYTTSFEARVAPVSAGSGYFALIFFGQTTIPRVQLPIQPGAAISVASTSSGGAFAFDLGGLPGSHLFLTVRYAGDSQHAASTATLDYVPVPSSLSLSPSSTILSAGASKRFVATVSDGLGNIMPLQAVAWSLSLLSLGTIDQSGLFTAGNGAGAGTITAQSEALSAFAAVTVTATNVLPSGHPVVVNLPDPASSISVSLGDFLTDSKGAAVSPFQAMKSALDFCRNIRAATLIIPPGRYVFDDPQLAATPNLPAVQLNQLSDLTIDGQGSEFLFAFPDHHGVVLFDCHRLLIKNLIVDWNVNVASPGVVGKEPDGSTSIRILDGYPVDSRTPVVAVTRFDLDRFVWLTNEGDYDALPFGIPVNLIRPQTFSSPSFAPFKEGTTVCVRHFEFSIAFATTVSCSDISFEDITVYGAPGHAFNFGLADGGMRLARCIIKRRPGTNRIISSAADAIHIGQVSGDVIVEDCEISGMGDDALTLYGLWFGVVQRIDNRTIVVSCSQVLGSVNCGNPVELSQGGDVKFNRVSDLHEYMRGRLTSVLFDPATRLFTVIVDRDLPAELRVGDLMANLSRSSSHFFLRRNFIHNGRTHGIFLNASDGLLEGNVIRDMALSGLVLNSDASYFMEGSGCEDVTVRGSVIDHSGNDRYVTARADLSVTSSVGVSQGVALAPSAIHRRLVIEDNRITGTPGLAALLASCDDVTFRNNSIVDANEEPPTSGVFPVRGSVMVTQASNVRILETHEAMTQTTYDSGVYVDPGTTTGVTVEGNVNDGSVIYQIPVVLDVFGKPPSHYTSDAVLVNRSPKATRVAISYLPAPGTPGSGGVASIETLPAGREWRTPDVISYLRSKGYSIPASGPAIVGSLNVEFLDVTDSTLVFAGSRTSTPNGSSTGGSFGLFAPAVESRAGTYTSATIFGLREDDLFRSNLALIDVPGGSGPATVSLQVFDGDTGLAAGDPIPYALEPGDWKQFNSILGQRGVRNGYVTVTKKGGGSNRFLLYGVVNDGGSSGGGTSDGSFIGPNSSSGLIPIVLRVQSGTVIFTSELLLANPSSDPVSATLTYTPSAQLTPGPSVTSRMLLGPGRQLRIPDVITYLKNLGLPLSDGATQGGTLEVRGAIAIVRTSNPNPDPTFGGTFGLAYPAYPAARRASTDAWIYGLRQDSQARSNLAIADGRVGDSTLINYLVEVYDSDSDNPAPVQTFGPIPLAGGQWYQISSILGQARVTHGYIHVKPQSGYSDFVVYGVINDGAAPGQGTSDGSYVSMVVTRR